MDKQPNNPKVFKLEHTKWQDQREGPRCIKYHGDRIRGNSVKFPACCLRLKTSSAEKGFLHFNNNFAAAQYCIEYQIAARA